MRGCAGWQAGSAAGNGAELGRVLGLVRGHGKAAAERRSGWAGKQTGPRRRSGPNQGKRERAARFARLGEEGKAGPAEEKGWA